MNAATITVNAARDAVSAATHDGQTLRASFGAVPECRFSFVDAPGARGTEIHASSEALDQKQLKAALRKIRALLEAGEIATGERRR